MGLAGFLLLALAVGCGGGGTPQNGGQDAGNAAPGTPLRAYPPPAPLGPGDLDPPGFWSGEGAGLWAKTPTQTPADAASALQQIGYAQGFETAPIASGVFALDPQAIQPGPNFYVSGHAAEAILMAQDGTVLHRWRFDYADIPNAPEATLQQAGCWRRAAVREDGTLYAIHEGVGLVALDRDSNLLWFHAGGEHHDLSLLDDGTIIVLAREAKVDPRIHAEYPILEDLVLWLSAEGREIRRLSLLDAWRNSRFAAELNARPYLVGDITHTNSLEILDHAAGAGAPAFGGGNLLLSARMLDTVFVVDPRAAQVIWSQRGPWRRPHDPSMTAAGTVLLFDNRGYIGHSQVLEFDPATMTEVWAYRGDPPPDFDSIFLGSAQRLANGNTLITEGCAGRAFEVTRAGKKVWEFISPHRTGEEGELVAALFDVVRLPEGFGGGW